MGIIDLDGNKITKLAKNSQAEKAGIALTKKGKPWVWKVSASARRMRPIHMRLNRLYCSFLRSDLHDRYLR